MSEKLGDLLIVLLGSITISIVCYPNLVKAMVMSFILGLGMGMYAILRGPDDRQR